MHKKTLSLFPSLAICLLGVCLSSEATAQSEVASDKTPQQKDAEAAKKWSIYWGWNRSTYSNSDIHFWGADHDFTLKNVAATDIHMDLSPQSFVDTYLNPANMTIPQTNLRIAYQYDADTAIALNLDHMKYVMSPDQVVHMQGQVPAGPVNGNQKLTTDFLNFEHTDGLNIISIELEKQRPVQWFGPSVKSRVFALVGAGIVLPKSNVTLNFLGRVRNDEFHLAGYSAGIGAGLEVDFCKDFFVRSAYKVGMVNLPDVVTSSVGDKASHRFNYEEFLVVFGARF